MPLQRRPRFAALALGTGLALLLSNAASATTPLMTDPTGDANVGASACQRVPGNALDPCPTSMPALSEPAIDIVEGDIVQDGTDLLFRVEVVDIDGAPLQAADRAFSFGTTYAGLSVSLRVIHVGQHDTTATGTLAVVDVVATSSTGSQTPVDVTLDPATNVLQWRVPLTAANAALAAVCATCAPIGAGSTFEDFSAGAGYEPDPTGQVGIPCVARCDEAEAHGTYVLS